MFSTATVFLLLVLTASSIALRCYSSPSLNNNNEEVVGCPYAASASMCCGKSVYNNGDIIRYVCFGVILY